MLREWKDALVASLLTFLLCAVAYPSLVFALGQGLFPHQAAGSLIVRDGKIIGSESIAQPFASPKYFTPRPSAAGAKGYAADAASGSNLATTNPALRERIAIDAARQIAARTGDADLKTQLARLDPATTGTPERDSTLKQVLTRAHDLGGPADTKVPLDLVTTSGSGLDPDITPEAARYQAPRVAQARNLPLDQVLAKINAHTDHSAALLGAPPRVNVLKLNLDLDGRTE